VLRYNGFSEFRGVLATVRSHLTNKREHSAQKNRLVDWAKRSLRAVVGLHHGASGAFLRRGRAQGQRYPAVVFGFFRQRALPHLPDGTIGCGAFPLRRILSHAAS